MRFPAELGDVQGVSWFVERVFYMFVEVELPVAAMPLVPLR